MWEIRNCHFDFTNSPDNVAIKIYIVDKNSLLSRLKGWWIGKVFRYKYMRHKNK